MVTQVLVGDGTQTGGAWHLLTKVTLCVSAASVPHPLVGVQVSLVGGADPVQKLLATTVPSVRTQVTVCVAWPEFAAPVQVPVRV